ncbi:MAG: FtsW/RodA/SpoVE family cell cycle protein [Brevundimonas sp.]|uniref:FtsW/RodA/SpoVE family cell cycle protein n=1 Tax=Brevundimonas sp. TaxID=1871086 RepID=UPI003919DD44
MIRRHPLGVTALGTAVAIGLGLVVQHRLGAPGSAMVIQAAAAGLGALLALGIARARLPGREAVRASVLIVLLVIMALPLVFGPELAGARRWLQLGPVSTQPSMILLPVVIWLAAAGRASPVSSLLVLAHGAVLALQFDAAALTGLTLAWAASRALCPQRDALHGWLVSAALLALSVHAWIRPDDLPSVAYVEQVLPGAWQAGAVTGAMASLAAVLVVAMFAVPERKDRALVAGLAAFYTGLVGAALIGNYPLPVVGLGASLVLGWLIALGLAAARPIKGMPS